MHPGQDPNIDKNRLQPRGRVYMDIAAPVRRPVAGPPVARPYAARPAAQPPIAPNPPTVPAPVAPAQPTFSSVAQPLQPVRPAAVTPVFVTPNVPTSAVERPAEKVPEPIERPALQPQTHAKKSHKKWLILGGLLMLIIAGAAYVLLSKTAVLGATKTTADLQVFNAAFAKCQPIKYQPLNAPNQLIPQVLGKSDGSSGCSVKLSYAGTPTEFNRLPGTEMTCDLDNTVLYATALGAAYDNPSQYNCSGSLVEQITKPNP